MKIYLIRHAESTANALHIWTGQTDADLSDRGIAEQKALCGRFAYPNADLYVSSPLLRCTHSMRIIYGREPDILLPDFMECSLGILEGRKYTNLNDDENYTDWLNNPEIPISGGESFGNFSRRAASGFTKVTRLMCERKAESAAVMLHGNVMRAILHAHADREIPHSRWKIPNGGVYELNTDGDRVCSWLSYPVYLFE